MRRWNGWGEESVNYVLSTFTKNMLRTRLGSPYPLPPAELAYVLNKIPSTRLPEFPFVDTSEETRLRHARGQSVGDLLALREGRLNYVPDGVAFPETNEQVRTLLDWALKSNFIVIPYGGGTSVVGHLTPTEQPKDPVLVISLENLNKLLSLEPTSLLARFEAGIRGCDLEKILQTKGYTLGHFPQSFDYSTLGGWIATRSSGQQSLSYGRIEQLFAGGRIETFSGSWDLPAFPASSTGPDLREWILGSEGKVGIITEAVMRISALPQLEYFTAYMLPDWNHGVQAIRELTQSRIPLSMLRLSNPEETQINFNVNPKKSLTWLKRYLSLRGMKDSQCLLIVGFCGRHYQVNQSHMQCDSIVRHNKGLNLGKTIGKSWRARRFYQPYLRETLLNLGYVTDTLETATNWDRLPSLVQAIENALRKVEFPIMVFGHVSHCYAQGASAYISYVFPNASNYPETILRWQDLKTAASEEIVKHGGTISHQHGVGRDHKNWLMHEKGEIGMQLIKAAFKAMDSKDQLNRGVLVSQ